jgi:hypothetical protein
VTHDALRALLPRYAAGDLTEHDAEDVRAHLASGCGPCLDDVYSRPVGIPVPPHGYSVDGRAATAPEPAPSVVAAADVPVRRGPVAVLGALLALALLILAGCIWLIADRQAREAARAREVAQIAARLGEVDARRAELAGRLEALLADLEKTRADARQQAEAARAAAEAGGDLAHQLEDAEARIATLLRGVRRRDAQLDRLLSGVAEERTLRELLAAPGVELLRLRAVPPFVEGRGHVVSHPARGRILVYAFDLPSPPAGTDYRLRVALADGRTVGGPTFRPDVGGDAVVPIRVDGAAARVAEVEILLEPGARAVLAGRAAG